MKYFVEITKNDKINIKEATNLEEAKNIFEKECEDALSYFKFWQTNWDNKNYSYIETSDYFCFRTGTDKTCKRIEIDLVEYKGDVENDR